MKCHFDHHSEAGLYDGFHGGDLVLSQGELDQNRFEVTLRIHGIQLQVEH